MSCIICGDPDSDTFCEECVFVWDEVVEEEKEKTRLGEYK